MQSKNVGKCQEKVVSVGVSSIASKGATVNRFAARFRRRAGALEAMKVARRRLATLRQALRQWTDKPLIFRAVLLAVFALGYFSVPVIAGFVNGNSPLFTRSGYDYAPSVIQNGTLRQYWWCGLGNIDGQTRQGDVIFYRTYNSGTGAWSATTRVLQPATGTWDGENICDPSVVRGNFSYNGTTYSHAMYYTALNTLVATNNPAYNAFNRIGVAFSNNGTTWVKYPNPVIAPVGSAGVYGAGQSAVYNSNGQANLFLTQSDDTATGAPRIYIRSTTNGINFSAPTLVTTSGLPDPNYTFNSDFVYNSNTASWYAALGLSSRPVAGERETYRVGLYRIPSANFLAGNGTWEALGVIDSNLTTRYLNHSPGIVHDIYGNLVGYPSMEVVLAGGPNDPFQWDLFSVKWNPSPQTLPFRRSFNASLGDHWVTTGNVTSGYALESVMGHLYMTPRPGTYGLYGCQIGNDHFISTSSTCENQTILGINGYIYTSPPTGIATSPLYRCRAGSNHFVSGSSSCEGQTYESFLGYAPSAPVN